MAVYDIQPDVKWPQQLGRVIQSYAQGQEIKRQRAMQQAQLLAEIQKAQQEQEKRAADIERIKALTSLMGRFTGGEQPAGGGALPDLQLDRIGASGPSFKVQQPENAEDVKAQIAKDAAVLKNLTPDSPMYKLVVESMMRGRKKLAELMDMELRETPAKKRSILGIDIPFTGKPAKTEVVPKVTQPRKQVQGKEIKPGLIEGYKKDLPFGHPTYRRTPPAVPKISGFDQAKKPGSKQAIKMPAAPKEPAERKEFDKVSAVWFKLPSSVQWQIWYGISKGLTWGQIAGSDDLKKYIK